MAPDFRSALTYKLVTCTTSQPRNTKMTLSYLNLFLIFVSVLTHNFSLALGYPNQRPQSLSSLTNVVQTASSQAVTRIQTVVDDNQRPSPAPSTSPRHVQKILCLQETTHHLLPPTRKGGIKHPLAEYRCRKQD